MMLWRKFRYWQATRRVQRELAKLTPAQRQQLTDGLVALGQAFKQMFGEEAE
jgi:hypothetical protein